MAVLPDILDRRTVTVLCGSAAGTASARRGMYYAGPGNRFWKTLFETGLTGRLLDPAEFARVAEYGLGLTDLAKREHGPDSALSRDAYDARELWRKIEAVRPRLLAFNGKAPARRFLAERFGAAAPDYGLQAEKIGRTGIFVLPSTSGAARRWWSIGPWRRLAELHRSGAAA